VLCSFADSGWNLAAEQLFVLFSLAVMTAIEVITRPVTPR